MLNYIIHTRNFDVSLPAPVEHLAVTNNALHLPKPLKNNGY